MNSQDKFYSSISQHYSAIFPFNRVQLDFVRSQVRELKGKSVLDVGCATGQLAFGLAEAGADVTGIDLNEHLLAVAREGIPQPNLRFRSMNMLHLSDHFKKDDFHAVLCFGNTLVHLNELNEMKQFFSEVQSVLKKEGVLLLQILNYDHILSEQITELPPIENKMIRFERHYRFDPDSRLVRFDTELYSKAEDKTIGNQTQLFALKSRELKHLLIQEGFSDIRFYASFKADPFGGKHLPLVVSCRK